MAAHTDRAPGETTTAAPVVQPARPVQATGDGDAIAKGPSLAQADRTVLERLMQNLMVALGAPNV